MLSWRAISRPANIIGQGPRFQIRFVHPSRLLHSQGLPRPNTLIAKIRFRVDGKPRSKLIAMGFGSLILSNLLTLLEIFNTANPPSSNSPEPHIAAFIYVQKTDVSYDTVDFDDPISTLSYYKKLTQSHSHLSGEHADLIFNRLAQVAKTRGPKYEIELQRIMRLTAEEVHLALEELTLGSPDSAGKTLAKVSRLITGAFHSISRLLFGTPVDHANNVIHNRDKKDVEALDHSEVTG